MDRKNLGYRGEDLACALLEYKGYKIIERNYKTKAGEIDIIAKNGTKLSFIEVKTRLSDAYGMGREAVDINKQMHIRKTAEIFLVNNRLTYTRIDFQVIEISIAHLDGLEF